jgi:hypothetical protein
MNLENNTWSEIIYVKYPEQKNSQGQKIDSVLQGWWLTWDMSFLWGDENTSESVVGMITKLREQTKNAL